MRSAESALSSSRAPRPAGATSLGCLERHGHLSRGRRRDPEAAGWEDRRARQRQRGPPAGCSTAIKGPATPPCAPPCCRGSGYPRAKSRGPPAGHAESAVGVRFPQRRRPFPPGFKGLDAGKAHAMTLVMKTPQTAWFKKRPQRMSALALGFLGLVAAPGVGLAQEQRNPRPSSPWRPTGEPAEARRPVVSVTLEEAIARALKTSPQVAQAAGTVTTSEAAERSAFGAYLPSLSANANSSLASSDRLDPETGAVVSGSSDTYSAGLSAGWDVFTGGQRSATRQADAGAVELPRRPSSPRSSPPRCSTWSAPSTRCCARRGWRRWRGPASSGRSRTRRPRSAGWRWARRRARTCCARSWSSTTAREALLTARDPAHVGVAGAGPAHRRGRPGRREAARRPGAEAAAAHARRPW